MNLENASKKKVKKHNLKSKNNRRNRRALEVVFVIKEIKSSSNWTLRQWAPKSQLNLSEAAIFNYFNTPFLDTSQSVSESESERERKKSIKIHFTFIFNLSKNYSHFNLFKIKHFMWIFPQSLPLPKSYWDFLRISQDAPEDNGPISTNLKQKLKETI